MRVGASCTRPATGNVVVGDGPRPDSAAAIPRVTRSSVLAHQLVEEAASAVAASAAGASGKPIRHFAPDGIGVAGAKGLGEGGALGAP